MIRSSNFCGNYFLMSNTDGHVFCWLLSTLKRVSTAALKKWFHTGWSLTGRLMYTTASLIYFWLFLTSKKVSSTVAFSFVITSLNLQQWSSHTCTLTGRHMYWWLLISSKLVSTVTLTEWFKAQMLWHGRKIHHNHLSSHALLTPLNVKECKCCCYHKGTIRVRSSYHVHQRPWLLSHQRVWVRCIDRVIVNGDCFLTHTTTCHIHFS
jgi:hypothetical protein